MIKRKNEWSSYPPNNDPWKPQTTAVNNVPYKVATKQEYVDPPYENGNKRQVDNSRPVQYTVEPEETLDDIAQKALDDSRAMGNLLDDYRGALKTAAEAIYSTNTILSMMEMFKYEQGVGELIKRINAKPELMNNIDASIDLFIKLGFMEENTGDKDVD